LGDLGARAGRWIAPTHLAIWRPGDLAICDLAI